MESVRMGCSGLQVSRLCLGTMIFGSKRDQSEAFAIMNMAGELGIDFLDVADVSPVPPLSETWGRTEESSAPGSRANESASWWRLSALTASAPAATTPGVAA